MKINSLCFNDGPSIYYDESFRNVLEDHITFLKNNISTTILSIQAIHAYRFEFDFYGLLTLYGVPPQLQWLVMRMNNIISPNDVSINITDILIPDLTVVDHIRQSHMATRRIN